MSNRTYLFEAVSFKCLQTFVGGCQLSPHCRVFWVFGLMHEAKQYLGNQCFKYIIFEITCIFSLVVNLKPTLDKGVSALIYGEPGLKTRKLLKLENKIVSADNIHSAPQC